MAASDRASAFAPATVANVAVGFDVLGFALEHVGDRVTVSRAEGGERVRVDAIRGVAADLPREPGRNTAAVALRAMLDDLDVPGSFAVELDKGIPLSAGMGGSAASAVAAVVAADALLGRESAREDLLRWALQGEAAASGAPHADNAAPSLYGGLTAVLPGDPPRVVPVPVPAAVRCVLVHPHLHVETKEARAVLRTEIALSEHVQQSARLAVFVAACHSGDPALLAASMEDVLIEPQRSANIPGFAKLKRVASDHGALGCSISGSGPSVFAWVPVAAAADDTAAGRAADVPESGAVRALAAAMRGVFREEGVEADTWVSRVGAPGARAE